MISFDQDSKNGFEVVLVQGDDGGVHGTIVPGRTGGLGALKEMGQLSRIGNITMFMVILGCKKR